jgi:hypothetical protein
VKAYAYLHGDGRNLIPHLGPSFGTKVLYFSGYGRSHGDLQPLILDQYVALVSVPRETVDVTGVGGVMTDNPFGYTDAYSAARQVRRSMPQPGISSWPHEPVSPMGPFPVVPQAPAAGQPRQSRRLRSAASWTPCLCSAARTATTSQSCHSYATEGTA